MNAVVGIDEVGRGCWAGPLVAAAVIMTTPLAGLKDSKILTASQRQLLDTKIRQQAVAIGVGWVSPAYIDANGLTASVRRAMKAALAAIKVPYDEVIIDGNYNFLSDAKHSRAIIRADNIIPSVSAASIIAKVARDRYMSEMASSYPQYGFDTHVGYGTNQHSLALRAYGVTPLHRLSYKPVKLILAVANV